MQDLILSLNAFRVEYKGIDEALKRRKLLTQF